MVYGQGGVREGSNWAFHSWVSEKMERQPSRGNPSPVRGIPDGDVKMA
jgi:hypothetical protein